MRPDELFLQPIPPLVETYSFRLKPPVPCLYEPPSQSTHRASYDSGSEKCPFREYCDEASGALWQFEQVFGAWIKVTLAEPSSSIVVRSEHQYNKQERHRLALRKHLYELSADHGDQPHRCTAPGTSFVLDRRYLSLIAQTVRAEIVADVGKLESRRFSGARELYEALRTSLNAADFDRHANKLVALAFSPLNCYAIDQSDRFGHYIGFVDLRLNSPRFPLAMGVLGLPRKYRHNTETFIITGNYGPLFGGPSFRSTVYTMHDPTSGGGQCAQACVIMALGLLSDRGARIAGTYSLTYLAKRASASRAETAPATNDPDHLGSTRGRSSTKRSWVVAGPKGGGLLPEEISNLLRADRQNSAWGTSANLTRDKDTPQSVRMAERLIEAYVAARCPVILCVRTKEWWKWSKNQPEPHAVIVIGFRRTSARRNLILITHDPGYQPYYERPIADCLEACRQYSIHYSKRNGRSRYELPMIFIAPRTIALHASECLLALRSSSDAALFQPFEGAADDRFDYRVALVVRDDIAESVYQRSRSEDRKHVGDLQRLIDHTLPRSRYWCVAALEDEHVQYVWMFDATRHFTVQIGHPWRAKMTFPERHVVKYEALDNTGQVQTYQLPSSEHDASP